MNPASHKIYLKLISEGTKTNSKEISRNHLVTTIRYLLDEFGWLKKSLTTENDSADEYDDAIDGSSTQPESDENGGEKSKLTPESPANETSSSDDKKSDGNDVENNTNDQDLSRNDGSIKKSKNDPERSQDGGAEKDPKKDKNNATQDKPFSCSRCEKKFAVKKDFDKHVCSPRRKPEDMPICRFYAAQKCKYGKAGKNKFGSCPFQHPEKCQKYTSDPESCKDWKICGKMHPAPICTFYLDKKCTRKNCFSKHPTDSNERNGGRDHGGDRRTGPSSGRGSRGENGNGHSGGGSGDKRLDLMEATLSSVLEAVKKLTSCQVNNNIQGTTNLNQAGVWLSQKSKVKGD